MKRHESQFPKFLAHFDLKLYLTRENLEKETNKRFQQLIARLGFCQCLRAQ